MDHRGERGRGTTVNLATGNTGVITLKHPLLPAAIIMKITIFRLQQFNDPLTQFQSIMGPDVGLRPSPGFGVWSVHALKGVGVPPR